MSLQAGAAKAVITPHIGCWMDGNVREEGSKGVHDELYARALLLQDDDGEAMGIVALDLCGFYKPVADQIRAEVAESIGLPPERLLVAATHTHAGPAFLGILGEPGDEQMQALTARLAAGAVKMAHDNLRPAGLAWGSATAQAPVNNRRLRTQDGVTHMNWEGLDPAQVAEVLGPTDPEVLVVRIDDTEGNAIASLVNYALHPAILAGDNWLLSADWPGYALGLVERERGGVGLLLNGATGNINHIDYRRPQQKRGFHEAHRLGTIIGAAALMGLLEAEDTTDQVSLGCASEAVTIPGRRFTEEQVQRARRLVASTAGPIKAQVDGVPEALFAAELLKLAERGDYHEDVEIQALRLGDGALVAAPLELFVEYQLDLKARSPLPHTGFVGYANDYQGYVPTPEAFEQGGYEPTPSGWSKLCPEAGQMAIDAGLRLLATL